MQLAQPLHHKGATRHPPPITRLLSLQRLDSPSITPIVILTNYSLPRLPTQLPVPVIIRSLSINTTDQQLPLRTMQCASVLRHTSTKTPFSTSFSLSRTQRTAALSPTHYSQSSSVLLKRERIANLSLCFRRMQRVAIHGRDFPIALFPTSTRLSSNSYRVLVRPNYLLLGCPTNDESWPNYLLLDCATNDEFWSQGGSIMSVRSACQAMGEIQPFRTDQSRSNTAEPGAKPRWSGRSVFGL